MSYFDYFAPILQIVGLFVLNWKDIESLHMDTTIYFTISCICCIKFNFFAKKCPILDILSQTS